MNLVITLLMLCVVVYLAFWIIDQSVPEKIKPPAKLVIGAVVLIYLIAILTSHPILLR